MTTFLALFGVVFGALLIIMAGMAIGAVFRNKPIQGSCGGLNAIEGADHCVICNRKVDPNSPLREKLQPCKSKAA
ncbi:MULTISPECIES: (Na+)-NQR maturation NqrM [Pseudovibrio]|uniref:(Na+)-NQR maturation NqrM n=1 Tax=Stappiaceae TaxID=2821832 RepID=UPI0023651803|nr:MULTISPECIES: (Na+)-NQR maturation NqrM [Pseudovibrio]MDD7912043.1 (Na+)-NQR maturation NqrM [Pseudovibrio exalbescens]MDX5595542.1 (Na+)-NQR maturation NqrM [Pseudovibrio sp. SPO723]